MEKQEQIKKLNFAKNIMERIISKGGVMGSLAKMYIENDENTDKFIMECAEQCQNKTAEELWGDALVLDILKYKMMRMGIKHKVWRSKKMAFLSSA